MSKQAVTTNRYSDTSSVSQEQIAQSTARLEAAKKRIEDAIERAKAGEAVKFNKSGSVIIAMPTESSLERKRIQPLVDALINAAFTGKSATYTTNLAAIRRIAKVFYSIDNSVEDLIKALTDYADSANPKIPTKTRNR